ncbi:MAG TPA: hypothetical protein VEP90_19770 [Methylomirabilota bacterium]|nr:hypothetical protein [Methylomirabilota bacterium]
MARKSIFGRSRWKHFKEHISILISEALLILRDKTDLPEDEKLLNRKLHSCFAEANYKLGLDYMPAFDAKNSPDPHDKQKAKREDNIPDLSWNIINHADNPEHCNRNFALECKRLGQPTSRSWILNEQYVKEGILRFLLDKEGYGKGCESGAMVGYVQNMAFDDILQEINTHINLRGVSVPLLTKPTTDWQHQGVSCFDHALVRSFAPSLFSLKHFWVDLRDHYRPSSPHSSAEIRNEILDEEGMKEPTDKVSIREQTVETSLEEWHQLQLPIDRLD